MKNHLKNRTPRRLLSLVLALSLTYQPLPALAASVSLATAPLATSTTSTVKPNVMFILDDSGSMGWDYLPDWANDTDPTSSGTYPSSNVNYTSVPALFRNAGFNGIAYNPAITYTPPVLYNADGTLDTSTYPNIGSPWTAVKNDAFGILSTGTTNLVTSFSDVEYCTDSTYTDCLRNDNLVLPGNVTISGVTKSYNTRHNKVSTGTGFVATGDPGSVTTAARTFGPFYYTTVPSEYCDSTKLKNCQTTQTSTFSQPAALRWCDSAALSNCRAINDATYQYPRYPTLVYTPAIPYSPAVPAQPAVVGVTGVVASASFTFNFSGTLSPVGFSIKINGTEMLNASTPGVLKTSSELATWVRGNSNLSGYTITASGSTVTITATTTGTAKNINSVVITEVPTSVTYTTSMTAGTSGTTAVRPTGLITFGGGTTHATNSAKINKTLSSNSASVMVGTNKYTSAITIGTGKTPVQAAAAVVAAIGTGGTIKAYVGGNSTTPTCAAQTTSVVCLVDTSTYTNSKAVTIGTQSNFNTLTVSSTATAGGVTGVVAAKAVGTLTFTNASSLNPTGVSIRVNGTEIMAATTPNAATSSTGMATWVKGNSSLANYVITNSGSTVTFTAAATGTAWNINTITYTQNAPATVTYTGPTLTPGVNAVTAQPATPYTPEVLAVPADYPGRFIRTDIVSSDNSYPYPGTSSKASTRSDCAGTTCTYVEEMTNFANWWTYYHTRMQSMKTSVSRAFKTLDNRFRVGFSTITETGATNGTKFLGNDTFELAHKNSWFTKLFATATPGSTPLRGALSKAGRYYGKKISGQVDPVQYSCQQNFTILSTDGYWNTGLETASYKALDLTGAAVGDKDGGTTARPMKQGTTAVADTLADIAKYYYDTDLRTSALGNCAGGISTDFASGNPDVCTNNVFTSSSDNNIKQHMTTFTMGLGIDGTLTYTSDYLTATSGDYYDLKNALGSPTVNWSDPINNSAGERIDDLWHAAVNGQGIYFSAKDPDSIITGFNTALSAITAKLGAAAAAATSTLNPVAGNNFAYVASYTTNVWKGNLEARSINIDTGVVSETAIWCVENVTAATCAAPGTVVADTSGSSTIYNCVVSGSTAAACTSPGVFDSITSECKTEIQNACTGTMAAKVGTVTDSRAIYTTNNAGTALTSFDAAYATANPTNFSAAHINGLNQWGTLTVAQRTAAEGVNLINYLRGQNGFEDRSANLLVNRLYRAREAVLGDALESQPAYLGHPVFNYPYPGYSAFKTAQAGRAANVYMGTNDGMMHAFAADNGSERWAYVPSLVIPNMWKLASTSYSNNHVNFVNGSALTTDVCTANCADASAVWKTVLVGGLNGGGREYYALDITDPATPTLLWEFTPADDSDLGYSFGVPVITKKEDGTWVVLVTSGYDNGSLSGNPLVNNVPAGSGIGYLYVLNAGTGTIISKISTNVGSAATPSGLAKIAAWNNDPAGNQAGYVYGGDLQGNLWRFDINSTSAATIGTGSVMNFATLFSNTAGTSPQAITTTPVLGKINDKRVVYVGTGKYLESSDLGTAEVQSQYAIMDDNEVATLVNPRATLTHRTLVNSSGTATRTGETTSCSAFSGRGWYVDFPDSKERVNIDSKLVQGTLLVPTIVPSSTVCSPGGYGWLNFFDFKTGCAVDNQHSNLAGVKYDSTIVGTNVIFIHGEPIVSVVTSTDPTPQQPTVGVPFSMSTTHFSGKRVNWRELIP